MPSPLAHSALVALMLPGAMGANRSARIPLANRIALGALLCIVLVLPDFDFAITLLNLSGAHQSHGSWSHSVIWVIPVGLAFALAARFLFPRNDRPPFSRLAIVGAVAYLSHILMDWANWGFGDARGVTMFWPILEDRFKSPVSLFVGVRWSQPGAYGSHLLTLGSEVVFSVLVVGVAARRSRRERTNGEVR